MLEGIRCARRGVRGGEPPSITRARCVRAEGDERLDGRRGHGVLLRLGLVVRSARQPLSLFLKAHSAQVEIDSPYADPMSSRLRIESVDVGPADLPAQLPAEARLLRQIAGPDRPDYFFAVLDEAIAYRTTLTALKEQGVDPDAADPQLIRIDDDGSVDLRVFGIVFAARIAGETPHAGMKDFPVMLAYVIDNTALRDEVLDFKKTVYAAVAFISDIDDETPAV